MSGQARAYREKPLEQAEDGNGELIPHVYTFASIWNTVNKTYSYRWDEAVRDNPQNAIAIERDCYIDSLRQERCMATVNREWDIKGDNSKDPVQKACGSHLKSMIMQIPRFKRMLEYLNNGATWMGRYGSQIVVKQRNVLGIPRWCVVKHKPVNGDKIQGAWDDTPAIQIHKDAKMLERFGDAIVNGDRVPMLLLKERKWRDQFIIHSYKVRDADYYEGEMAGAVQGEGLRSKIYWAWWLRDEMLSWAVDFMKKVGTLGLLIFPFEEGSVAGEERAKLNAKTASNSTAMVMPVVNNGLRGSETAKPFHVPSNPAGIDALQHMISEYFETHMERLIVGQSMSSGGGGAGGLEGDGRAEFAEDTKFQLLHFDADNLAETLTTDLVDLLMRLNFPEYDFKMRFEFVVPDPRASEKLQDILSVIGVGVGAKIDQLQEMCGIEKPEPGDETVGSIEQVYAKHGEMKYLTPRGGLAKGPAQQEADDLDGSEDGPAPLQLAELDNPELYYPEQPAEDAERARGHREGGWHPFGSHTQLGANHEKLATSAGLPAEQLHHLAKSYHESTGMHPAVAYGHALMNLKLARDTMGKPAGTKGKPLSLDDAPQRGTAPKTVQYKPGMQPPTGKAPAPPAPTGRQPIKPGVADPRFAGDAKAKIPFAEPTDEPATGTATRGVNTARPAGKRPVFDANGKADVPFDLAPDNRNYRHSFYTGPIDRDLLRGNRKKMAAMDAPISHFDPKDLTATQDKIDSHGYDNSNPDDPIYVVRHGGKHYIADGHHRAARAAMEGRKIAAKVFEIGSNNEPMSAKSDPRHNPDLDAAFGSPAEQEVPKQNTAKGIRSNDLLDDAFGMPSNDGPPPETQDWRPTRSKVGEFSPSTGQWRPDKHDLFPHWESKEQHEKLGVQAGQNRDMHAQNFKELLKAYSQNPEWRKTASKMPHIGSLLAGNPVDWKHAHGLRDEVDQLLTSHGIGAGSGHHADRLRSAANAMIDNHEQEAIRKHRAANWKAPEPTKAEGAPPLPPDKPSKKKPEGDGMFAKRQAESSTAPQPSAHDQATELLKHHTGAILEGHNAGIADHNAIVDEVKDELAKNWLHDPQKHMHPSAIGRKLAAGHIEQADDIPGMDEMAEVMARKYPGVFKNGADQQQLFDMFKEGRKKGMSKEEAEEKALEMIADLHNPGGKKPAKKDNDDVIPFQAPERPEPLNSSRDIDIDVTYTDNGFKVRKRVPNAA